LKIVISVDKIGSAIDRLARDVQKNLPHLDIVICDCHPKRPDPEQLERFRANIIDADIFDCQYWKSGLLLLDLFPNELKNKPKILAHHNPYNLQEHDWKEFDSVVVNNKSMQKDLKDSKLIHNAVDLSFFQFQREMSDSKKVIMVAARIEGKKGILPVAEVCRDLGYQMILVGSISDREYFDKIMATGVVDFRERISDEDLLKAYYESAIHVCNSVDNFESGPLPLLESMGTGVPVLTRRVGIVGDIYDETNMIVRKGEPEDLEDLKTELKKLMEDKEKRNKIRGNAWKSVKSFDSLRRALKYEKLYYDVLYSNQTLVSVIIPTFNRLTISLDKVVGSILTQDWQAKEIVLCDDGSTDGTKEAIMELRKQVKTPIKFVETNTPNEYNLAFSKNLGVIEAVGEILVFLDDRYEAEPNFLSEFAKNLYPKMWLYGNKGTKKDFVENVSCIYRQEFIEAGMFNQSCKLYGFQSQELRNRFKKQGFKLKFIETAKVKTLFETKNKYKKRDEIISAKNILWRMNLE